MIEPVSSKHFRDLHVFIQSGVRIRYCDAEQLDPDPQRWSAFIKKSSWSRFLHTDIEEYRTFCIIHVFRKMASILYSPRNSQAAYFLLTSLLIYSLYLSWSSTGALRAHLCAMSWSSTGALCAHLCALALLRMLRSFNQTGIENILYL
jgi:hypothetical protein